MGNLRLALTTLAFAAVLLPAAPASASGPPASGPEGPTSTELVAYSDRWDGREITYSGEVVAEPQERGDHAWIHVNDDAYARTGTERGSRLGGYNTGHAVWLSTDLAEKVRTFGDHKHEGDVVTVSGTFNAACAEHGGDMDIHASALEVDSVGHGTADPVDPLKLVLGLLLSAVAVALWMAMRRAENRELLGLFGR